jgi:hypothetical protein
VRGLLQHEFAVAPNTIHWISDSAENVRAGRRRRGSRSRQRRPGERCRIY